ncbi:ribonuclease 1-like [Tripterygium wilfordii]|uniref:ribonuclease 1-like n=1 Tax=Tripterygium wilfordii TaxID=458696 RepID=UPI0018F7FEBF|nr:ribonuclease 1-like [Tripterygium wilfordii]
MGLKTIIFALVLILLLAFQTRAAGPRGRYDFYKVAIRWPKSFLNSGKSVQRGGYSHKPTLTNFTIHGLFPMYTIDEVVPPYDEDSGCTESKPKRPEFITIELFDDYDLLTDMKTYWPDVAYYRNMTDNLQFWRREWQKHAMCFDRPDMPTYYYKTALRARKKFDFLDTLIKANIKPNNEKYNRTVIGKVASDYVGKKVEISCNTDSKGNRQLDEILVCYTRNGNERPCPFRFTYCGDEDEFILFPSAAAAA